MSHDAREELGETLTQSIVDLDRLVATSPELPAEDLRIEERPSAGRRARRAQSGPRKKRPKRPKRRSKPSPSDYEVLEWLLRWPVLYEIARQIAVVEGGPGPDWTFPPFMILCFIVMVSVLGSKRSTEAFFAHRITWRLVQQTLEDAWPDDLERRVGQVPIRRDHVRRFCDRYLFDGSTRELLDRAFMEAGADQAQRLGLMEEGAGTLSKPEPKNVFIGDQTVLPARWKAQPGEMQYDEDTGELFPVRFDPDARLCHKTDGSSVAGTMWIDVHVRAGHENERVHLGYSSVDTGDGGDGQVFMTKLIEAKALSPAGRHYVYDMSVRGVHVQQGYEVGLVPLVKVALASGGKPATASVERVDATLRDGSTKPIEVWALNGALGMVVDVDSKSFFIRLEQERLRFRHDKNGKRLIGWYVVPDVPAVPQRLRGARLDAIRFDQTAKDDRRRYPSGRVFKRPEFVRPIPEGSAVFKEVHGLREDAESTWSVLKNTLSDGLAHSITKARQWVDLLGFFLLRNLRALMAFTERTGVNPYGNLMPSAVTRPGASP